MSKLRDMKKRFLPLSMLLITIVLAQASLVANAAGDQGNYTPRNNTKATFSSFMKSIRANQETGLIDPALLIEGQKAAQSSTKSVSLDWEQAGPDNFGGLTRAVVYDNNGNVLIGTMGGDVYRTTNNGITFEKITNLTLPISCMVKNANGDIFIGTGDGRDAQSLNGLSELGYDASFIGKGIYKMAAGSTTPELLAATTPTATNGWGYVNEMTITNNKIYAATAAGIMLSEDNGETWTNILNGSFRSVKSNNNDDVLAADDTMVYLKKAGAEFVQITGTGNLPSTNTNMKIIAMSESDANYMYIAYLTLVNSNYGTGDLYFTADGGETWQIALAGTALYPIFGDDANYNGFITVYPNNPKKLLIGSENLWLVEDITGSGVNSYRPTQISESNCYEYTAIAMNRYIYLHRGIQNIAFDPSNPNTFFVGTTGGVFKGEYYSGVYSFKNSNRYFLTDDVHTSVARMMSIGVGGSTKILGGCLDHGTIEMLGDENINNVTTGTAIFPNPDPSTNANQQFGYFVKGYEGGPCVISTVDPNILFVSATGSNDMPIFRSQTNGEDYDATKFGTIGNENAFRTPYALFENYNDANNPVDTIFAPIRTRKYAGETAYAYSLQAGYPVEITLGEPPHDAEHTDEDGNYCWIQGDTIKNVHDPISTLLVCGVEDKIYMTRMALIFNQDNDWLLISEIEGLPTSVTISSDGDMAMVGTAEGTLYRVTGLANAYTAEQANVDSTAHVVTCDSLINFNNQAITSIAIDPANNNNVVVTLGNYGNNNYVYRSTNAGTSFNAIQGNLGQFPVYSSIIEKSTGLIILGTENGIYVSDNNGSSWEKSGDVSCPVMDIKQAIQANHDDIIDVLYDEQGTPTYVTYPGVSSEGMIYAATYGSGIISCANYKEGGDLSVDDNEMTSSNMNLNIYPNPVRDNAKFNITLNENARVSYKIYDLSGRMVASSDLGFYGQGEHSVSFSTANLASGSYIISVQAGNNVNNTKILVY